MEAIIVENDNLIEEVRIRKEVTKDALEISRVYAAPYQKEGTLSAEIRQAINTRSFYPTKSVSNEMQDNIFDVSEFGIAETHYDSVENRVSWIPVPLNTTVESVKAQIAKFPSATNYKVLASKPVMTSDQVRAVAAGLTTVAIIANRQVLRYPATTPNAGKLILDANGKPQYRHIYFSRTAKEDCDWRVKDMKTSKAEDYYTTPEIEAEIQETGQVVL